jgi:tetratricopeptide (TPR) repeat protein
MKKYVHRIMFGVLIALPSVWLIPVGCTPRPRHTEGFLDTSEHHGFNGFQLIKHERVDDAQREFELALELDPKYPPAHRGMGLVYGMKKQFKSAIESMGRARDYAQKKEDKALADVGFMRLHIMKKGKGWMDEVKKNFSRAGSTLKDLPEAFYYMGIAYKYGYRFDDSEKALKRVLKIKKTLILEADEQLKIVRKIKRAKPESEFGKRAAVKEHVTRADAAALFIQELRLNRIYEKARRMNDESPIRSPADRSRLSSRSIPGDVENHPLKMDITVILQLDIKGLRTFPDGTFLPDEYVTRAGYAIMLADIIAKIENNPSLDTRYAGRASPFKDVRNDVPYFNAIMVCTTRGGIMEVKNGFFEPMVKVSGADALLVIRRLKEELRIF